eukprot:403375320
MPAVRHDTLKKLKRYQIQVFIITYFAYICTHIQREFWAMSKEHIKTQLGFEDNQLSNFDFAQLLMYSISVFSLGVIGDTLNKKILLTSLYLSCAILYCLQGLGGSLAIKQEWYYYMVFILVGFSTSLIFPSFVAILGEWFPKKRRGAIIGLWATCINIGNIIGVQLASGLLKIFGEDNWQGLMYTVGALMLIFAIIFVFLLQPDPEQLGLSIDENQELEIKQQGYLKVENQAQYLLQNKTLETNQIKDGKKLNFFTAWLVPRVFLYSATLFCAKLAVYSMLLQLPSFLKQELNYSDQQRANVSTCFDSGAIFGSIILGYLSDKIYSKRSPVTFLGIICASAISFTITYTYQNLFIGIYFMIFLLGFFISGLCNMINASVAADLGKQPSLSNNPKALCTVASVVDGSGALGSAIGSLIIGATKKQFGWRDGFWLVISIDILFAIVPLQQLNYM